MSTKRNKKTNETVIYCGPTIRKVDLRQNQVFNAGIPETYSEVIQECPAIKSLIVPVSQLPKVKSALSVSSSPESILYKKVNTFLGGIK